MPYPLLTAPLTIRSLTLKNRMVMPALHHAYTRDGACTPRFSSYYWRRAEGGLGLVIVGSCRFDGYGAKINSMSLADDSTVPGWKEFTDGMHRRGCPVCVQLFHAGRYIPRRDVPCGQPALSPSATYTPYTRETAPEMTREQIRQVVRDFAAGAVRAVAAGSDAVEISGSSGYLLCQFLSPLTNRRADEYGGSFENRCRFPLEVIAAVREAVGPDYPLFYRLGADDLVPGSSVLEDAVRFAPLAQAAGIDCFDVTGGWHESRVPQLTGEVPPGGLFFLARSIRRAVTVPVIQCNRINSPRRAELALALGDADLVGLGRASLADPDFARKVTEDRAEEIRPCVACNQGCLANAFFDAPITCHTNPVCGLEHRTPDRPAVRPGRVLVIGGGPAGCEAALRCAQYGHRVTLWEKKDALGGQLRLAARLPGRGEFERLLRFYTDMLPRLGVEVRLGREGVPGEDLSLFDHVLLAVGGAEDPVSLPVAPGAVPVASAREALSGAVIPGERVVVAGGSFIGCESARFLARQAALGPEELFYLTAYAVRPPEQIGALLHTCRRTITLLEPGKKVGYGYEPGVGWPVLQELDRLGVVRRPLTRITRVGPGGVTAAVRAPDGTEEELYIPCDTVVAAAGVRPDTALAAAFRTAGTPVTPIGNARVLGRSIDAIRDGWAAAVRLSHPASAQLK